MLSRNFSTQLYSLACKIKQSANNRNKKIQSSLARSIDSGWFRARFVLKGVLADAPHRSIDGCGQRAFSNINPGGTESPLLPWLQRPD
jgi:hypothetical protein